VDLVAAVVADEQPFEVVQPGEGALDDPAGAAESRAVLGPTASDLRTDAEAPKLAAILLVVVAAIGDNAVWAVARPAALATHARHTLDQRHQLRDVVAVTAGDRPGERDPGRVYEKVMLGAVSGSINRARARRGAPLFACT
jgi:hypothetical protein